MTPISLHLILTALTMTALVQVAHTKKVVVVGGGIAGLAAARKLIDEGGNEYEVTVFEARPDRYGGRIWTNDEDFSAKIDLGASWIHGSNGKHPITKLAKKFNIQTVETNEDSGEAWNQQTGTKFTYREFEDGWESFEQIYEKVMKAKSKYDTDISLRQLISEENLNDTFNQPIVLMYTGSDVEASYGTSIENLSAKLFYGEDEEFEGQERVFPDGYIQIVEGIVNGGGEASNKINILLDHKVTKIKFDKQSNNVTLTVADGTTFTADKVIVAVPLGVLKTGDITFEPELSAAKVEAIEEVGFGVLNKLVIEFDEVFWPEDVTYFGAAPATEDRNLGMLTHWLALNNVVNKPILMAFLSGHAALDSEELTSAQLGEKAMDILRIMFGDAAVDARTVVSMVRTKWHSDEYARGSYTYPAVGNKWQMWKTLGEPGDSECPLLFFAGEHTESEHYSTVHGAYMSGERAANQVMDAFQTCSCQEKCDGDAACLKKCDSVAACREKCDNDDATCREDCSSGAARVLRLSILLALLCAAVSSVVGVYTF